MLSQIVRFTMAGVALGLVSTSLYAAPEIIVHNAAITNFDNETFSGFAVEDGRFSALSNNDKALLKMKDKDTLVIDAKGRRAIPGINDSHLHVVRGGRFYNLETRWEGIESLKEALTLLSEQAKRTPDGQWVRVVGGWTPYQFDEKRMPTVDELNEAVPDKPAFLLFLYSGGMLNKAAMKELGINKDSVAPEGSRYERDAKGNPTGLLIADPNPMILYKTIGALPHMSAEEQYNSSLHYYRKLLSLGVTSVIDAGGGGHQFPDNYQASAEMAINGDLPIRISNYLFPQQPKQELNQYAKWMSNYKQNQNLDGHKHNGYVIEGGGELLVWSASDYENFTSKRPDLQPEAETEIEQVIRLHVLMGWPFRIHATYDESISRMLNVLEKVNSDQPLSKVRWAFDHAETISDANLERVKALGGGIAVQGRMAFAGEYFLERYGKEQTRRSPPIKKMLEMGIPVGLGTDGTRVSSFNPWAAYYWAVSGRTVGGTQLYGKENRLDRLTALKLFTQGSAWFSSEELEKGQIKVGQFADFSLLDRDILKVDEQQLLKTQSLLTVVDGKVRYGSDEYKALSPVLPKAIPEWSPVNY